MKRKLLLAALCVVGALGFKANAQSFTDGGKYYFQNVESGKYWGAGDHANWGTRAMLVTNPEYVILHPANDTYQLESQVSNGGTAYYFEGDYMDNNQPINLTITSFGEYYTIANGTNFFGYDGTSTVLGKKLASNSQNALWKIIPEADMIAALNNASVENPMDATFLFLDPGFGRNNRNYTAWTISASNLNIGRQGTDQKNNYGCGESYHSTFSLSQTQEVPNGVYKITGRAFYRQDGSDNDNLPYFKVNDKTENFPLRTGAESSMQQAQASFANGTYAIDPIYVEVTDGSLSISLICNQAGLWCIWDGVELTYYGPGTVAEVLLADDVRAYKEALAEAQGYITQGMFEADANTLSTVIAENTLDLSNVTKEQLEDATANLVAANLVAAPAAAKYAIYTAAVERTTGNTNVNLTDLVVNAGFETGTMEGWTSVDGGAQATNKNFSKMSGDHFVERWKQNVALGAGSLTHDALCLPKGIYTITAEAQNIEQYNSNAGGKGYFLCANEEKAEIGDAGTYSTVVMLNDKDELTIQFLLDNCTGNWISCDNVTLTYVGEDFPAYTLVTGKMNAEVSAAQTAADEAFKASKTVANYNALTAAITAAQASVDAYAHLTAAVTKIQAAATSVSANGGTVTDEQKEALQTLLAAYTIGTIADADVLKKVAEGYELVVPIIKTQTASSADFTLAIRNQSFEYGDMTGWTATASSDTGVRETSNANYAATGSDGYYLFNTWWQGVPLTQTVEGLPNGQYTLTASVSSDGATIYLIANGEHNEGTETGGSNPTKDTFQEATITFLVKDGNATIGVVGGADGTAGEHKDYTEAGYWWYKADNFRLMKNRDLTEEEAAVAPTAIALYNGEVEVTEPIALDATTTTVTLTPVFEPGNATETVTWTSSDESVATVADGVVTAVLPGIAKITVTSTIDTDVYAEATVKVTFPETETAAEDVVISGPALSTVTYGENLIKNGTFEYPNSFYGWTDGQNPAKELTSSNFDVVEDGDSKYIRSKNHNGAGGAGSIGTAWPIEAGKTYVFGYKAKAVNAGTTDFHVVSLTNTLATETSKISTSQTVGTDWTDIKYKFTNTEGYAYVQFRARWLGEKGQLSSFDDFYLVEVTDETTVGNVQYALDAISTTNVGTGAFQYSQNAINAANALVQGEATVAEVEAAYEAVTTLNAPEATQAYNLVFNCEGHSATGNALTLIPNPAQTQGLYGLKYLAPANVNLAQAFYFVHTTGNKYKVFAVDTDGNDRYITTQAEGYGTTWYDGIRTITEADKAMEIEIRPNGEGLYLLWNTGANKPIAHNGNNNNDMFTNNTANFQFIETTKPSIAINTTEAGYGTIMLPFAKTLPNNGVKVYTCAAVNEKELTLTEVDAIEANKPYIIEGAWEEVLTGDAQGTALTYTDGLLTGVYAKTEAPVGSYVLQNQDDGVAFYLVEEDKDITGAPAGSSELFVPANRAYLTAPAGANVRALFFPEAGDATGIAGLDVLTSGSYDAIYTANGVKVSSLQKGLNIVKKGNKSYKIFVK